MPKHRLLTEFGIGSSLRHQDYTAAARRALQDALWRNSINLAELFGKPKEAMIIDVEIAVQQPDQVDCDTLSNVFPYGQISVTAVKGGLDVPRPVGLPTVIANAVINVSLMLEPKS
ncbi:Lin0512 family protein [Roseovarius rhodophyticola]|uniref:Lin0512 family protein n=1 Tax=Roseovarius rhodophyticola TaxID=3080827 RepID=A0ABZ2TCF2_9RHOB|nr:Lin0512 family protein [Roseovarius sp. W115]MDV2930492.1 Lin0512 family protein [Roseovarius sp. W115]